MALRRRYRLAIYFGWPLVGLLIHWIGFNAGWFMFAGLVILSGTWDKKEHERG